MEAPAGNVLVTGAARRIGAAIARDLAAHGHGVVIHYHKSGDEAKTLQAEIVAAGGRAVLCEADLAKAGEAEALIDRAGIALGEPLTALVNNASLFAFDRAADVTRDALERHYQINVIAPVILARDLVRQLPDGMQGVIVNLLDQKLANPNPDFFSYSLSRYAMAGATMLMAQEFAGRCRVNGVAPGITLPSADQSDAAFAAVARENLLERVSNAQYLADAVRMLLRNDAINGQCLWVDGGQRFMNQPRDVMFMEQGAA
ncbi:SDR family oxidoreductase [Rhizorhapis sp. SPR117]|uniref:SDR family oxidoreductase n=1 Tax=Rhizorhapis sp. SPR117 TaxID=2912611 RepID=UPI001F013AE4|nr:SDR family oxidoreductase [Rhizorhapis sp. SPR117]